MATKRMFHFYDKAKHRLLLQTTLRDIASAVLHAEGLSATVGDVVVNWGTQGKWHAIIVTLPVAVSAQGEITDALEQLDWVTKQAAENSAA